MVVSGSFFLPSLLVVYRHGLHGIVSNSNRGIGVPVRVLPAIWNPGQHRMVCESCAEEPWRKNEGGVLSGQPLVLLCLDHDCPCSGECLLLSEFKQKANPKHRGHRSLDSSTTASANAASPVTRTCETPNFTGSSLVLRLGMSNLRSFFPFRGPRGFVSLPPPPAPLFPTSPRCPD
jgi:hypothetical protein